jgi:hypothetical protein
MLENSAPKFSTISFNVSRHCFIKPRLEDEGSDKGPPSPFMVEDRRSRSRKNSTGIAPIS